MAGMIIPGRFPNLNKKIFDAQRILIIHNHFLSENRYISQTKKIYFIYFKFSHRDQPTGS